MSVAILLILLLIVGGPSAFFQALGLLAEVFFRIFPIFAPAIEQAIEDYLASPYFIVGVIIFACSLAGIVLSIRQRKILYIVISGLVNLITLVSIVSNLACSSY